MDTEFSELEILDEHGEGYPPIDGSIFFQGKAAESIRTFFADVHPTVYVEYMPQEENAPKQEILMERDGLGLLYRIFQNGSIWALLMPADELPNHIRFNENVKVAFVKDGNNIKLRLKGC